MQDEGTSGERTRLVQLPITGADCALGMGAAKGLGATHELRLTGIITAPASVHASYRQADLRLAEKVTGLVAGEPAPADYGDLAEYRRLYLKYARLAVRIAAAGWQPVTHARAVPSRPEDDYRHGTRMKRLDVGGSTYYQSADDTYEAPTSEFSMERFGDGSNGLYFTLRSFCRYDEAVVSIDLESLGVACKALQPVELVEGRQVVWDVCERWLRLAVSIKHSETLVLGLQ
jgi:hypothetical protein